MPAPEHSRALGRDGRPAERSQTLARAQRRTARSASATAKWALCFSALGAGARPQADRAEEARLATPSPRRRARLLLAEPGIAVGLHARRARDRRSRAGAPFFDAMRKTWHRERLGRRPVRAEAVLDDDVEHRRDHARLAAPLRHPRADPVLRAARGSAPRGSTSASRSPTSRRRSPRCSASPRRPRPKASRCRCAEPPGSARADAEAAPGPMPPVGADEQLDAARAGAAQRAAPLSNQRLISARSSSVICVALFSGISFSTTDLLVHRLRVLLDQLGRVQRHVLLLHLRVVAQHAALVDDRLDLGHA